MATLVVGLALLSVAFAVVVVVVDVLARVCVVSRVVIEVVVLVFPTISLSCANVCALNCHCCSCGGGGHFKLNA
jgi:hypothetical protein